MILNYELLVNLRLYSNAANMNYLLYTLFQIADSFKLSILNIVEIYGGSLVSYRYEITSQ